MINNSTIRVREYLTAEGENPVRDWLKSQPSAVSARVQARIFRIELGNLGDIRHVGHGVHELRIHVGPGIRVYVGREGTRVIILLCGGSKRTQAKDIAKARRYWLDYLERGRHGTSIGKLE